MSLLIFISLFYFSRIKNSLSFDFLKHFSNSKRLLLTFKTMLFIYSLSISSQHVLFYSFDVSNDLSLHKKFFPYIKMSEDSSLIYYQKKKKLVTGIKVFPKRKKKKNSNINVTDIKVPARQKQGLVEYRKKYHEVWKNRTTSQKKN